MSLHRSRLVHLSRRLCQAGMWKFAFPADMPFITVTRMLCRRFSTMTAVFWSLTTLPLPGICICLMLASTGWPTWSRASSSDFATSSLSSSSLQTSSDTSNLSLNLTPRYMHAFICLIVSLQSISNAVVSFVKLMPSHS
jgi:hypothetical protein